MKEFFPLDIGERIFDDLADDRNVFCAHVTKHYRYKLALHDLEPLIISGARMLDAHDCYRKDKERMRDNLPKRQAPDHFKLAGVLAFWLRRHAPVYELKELPPSASSQPQDSKIRALLLASPSELLAFDLGLRICDVFVNENKNADKKLSPVLDAEYFQMVSYLLKFKSVSPHSLGLIYRSLFIPLKPLA